MSKLHLKLGYRIQEDLRKREMGRKDEEARK